MYKYVKSDIDLEDLYHLGLESMWDDPRGRREIINLVKDTNTSSLVDWLEKYYDDGEFKKVMFALAEATGEFA